MNKMLGPVAILIILAGLVGYGIYNNNSNKSDSEQIASETTTQVDYDCTAGKTAYDILADQHEVSVKDTDFGKQVIGINGSEAASNQYWAFYVDGLMATVGAEAYTCTGGEKVTWQLDSF